MVATKTSRPLSRSVGVVGGGDPDGLVALAGQYLEWMDTRNFSPRTVEGRLSLLRAFLRWCADRDLVRPGEVTRPIVERYQRWLYHQVKKSGQPLSFVAQRHYLVAVRSFFQWLSRNHHVLYNPAADLYLPRMEKRLPRHVLTAEEAELVLAQPDVRTLEGLRDRAILEVFYSCGLRRSELARLRIWDLAVERGTLTVRQGKGKKDRVVPIGERAIAWVEKYTREVRPELVVPPDEGQLFLTIHGGPPCLDVLSVRTRKYVLASGVPKRGACHLFRHTMATLMLEGGADVRFVQEMLGHENLSTTQIYTRVSIPKLKAVHSATHPGAKLRQRDEAAAAGELEEDLAGVERADVDEGGAGKELVAEPDGREALLSSLAAEAADEVDDLEP